MSTSSRSPLIALVFFALAHVPLIWFSGMGVFAVYDTAFRVALPIILVTLLPLAVAAVGFSIPNIRALGVFGAVMTLGMVAYFIFGHGYLVEKTYAQDVVEVDEVPSYADRAPWTVANSYAQRDQGDIVGNRTSVHYVPASADANAEDGEGTSRYTTLVTGRAFLGMTGYEAVQVLNMPTSGVIPGGASTYCEFPESMDARQGAFWAWHSLSWKIHAKSPTAHYDVDDSYAYCEDDRPVVVVPLWKWEGLFTATKVPNGAAVYTVDGVQIMNANELEEAGIEGPTYPRSIAELQRESINANGSLGDYLGQRYGYDTTTKDEEDSNAENSTEFTLINDDGVTRYVTPLTPRGDSSSITAISEIDARQDGEGRSEVRVNTSPDLTSTSTLVTTIKESSVEGDNAWTTRWASGMRVYEILPGKDGHWVASIGQGQAVSYRADIAPDGSVTVVNSDTGASSEDDEEKESVTVPGDTPLADMTEEQLLDQIQTATEELQKRQEAETTE